MQELTISARESGQRLDKFLKKYLDAAPAGFIYKMLRKKNIVRNGKKASGNDILEEGDLIRLFLSDELIASFRSRGQMRDSVKADQYREKIPAFPEILYEDRDVVAVNKPAGLLSQPADGSDASLSGILPSMLLARGTLTEEELRAFHPSPLQRLDRNTSGVVLCGKSVRGAQYLADCISSRRLKKEYLAIASGDTLSSGVYTAYMKKSASGNSITVESEPSDGSLEMTTGIEVVDSGRGCQLLRVELITGRKHQIRAHLRFLGCPVIGDPKYGDAPVNRLFRKSCGITRQMLHAERVTFPDEEGICPDLKGAVVSAPLPEDFRRLISHLGFHLP